MTYFLDILNKEYESRKKRNPSYSIRSFARSLGIPSSTLTAVMAKKRRMPLNYIDTITEALSLSENEHTLFKESIKLSRISLHSLAKQKTSFINNDDSKDIERDETDLDGNIISCQKVIMKVNHEKIESINRVNEEYVKKIKCFINDDTEGIPVELVLFLLNKN